MTMRALGLLSGGLDSALAARILGDMGVQVECVRFETGFCREDYSGPVAGLDPEVVDVAEEYFERVVVEPKYGYGASMNPCIDCRIFMLRRADDIARSRGIELLFSGEIIGQSALTQSRAALLRTEREAGVTGQLLRPLCALHLDATASELRGEIDRSRLGRMQGRSRRAQYAMAVGLGIESYPTPSGGCCWLARADFGRRLRDQLSHRRGGALRVDDIELLKRGRHFRLAWNLKAILGRNEEESRWLADRAGGRWSCQVADGRGSFGLLEVTGEDAPFERAAALAARYSGHRASNRVEILLQLGGDAKRIAASPATAEAVEKWRI
jgi:tRNA U34 2-thiouridine synthase MnmA/TrmU